MSGINAFEDHLNTIIKHAMANTSISHMTDENGNTASWKSKVWIYTNDQQQSAILPFTTKSMSGAKLTFYRNASLLPSPQREICMLYAIRVMARKTSNGAKKNCVAAARETLASAHCLEDLNAEQLKEVVKGKTSTFRRELNQFIEFLNESVFQHNPLRKLLNDSQPSKTGDEEEAAQKDKVPDEKCIAALGAITHDVISPKKALWKTSPLHSQRETFVCTMVSLAMGAPNRAAAEQTVLDAQRLQKHTEIKSGKEDTVHFLNWKGSKGYKNNQNYILDIMSKCVERCLDYMLRVTEPNRILARFYTEPTLPLKSILRKRDCNVERWQRVNPELNKPTNMVILGYLLGLFDGDATIQVVKGTEGAYKLNPQSRNSAWIKAVWAIKNNDTLKITSYSVGDFIGLKPSKRAPLFKGLELSGAVPLKEVQATWISHIKKTYPAYPEMRNQSKKGRVDAQTMLFALSGKQMAIGAGSNIPGASSAFFPVSPTTLADIFGDELKSNRTESIFARHGFSNEFSMLPHQFRHYINHTAFESGVPKLIINIWSGRKDPTQILHYIHTSNADQASMVSDIMFNEGALDVEQAKTHVRVISQQEYNELTGTIASETSSGVCTQALHITPCEYLNDFDTQCLFCEKSCHVAHDDEAIELLTKDLKHQQQRLEQVSDASQFTISKASQKWYKVHCQHTEMLTQLLALMKDENIPKGSLIRLLRTQSEFRITDLQTKQVEIKQLCLPDVDKDIAQLISEKSTDDSSNDIVNELLELI